jgi:TnpA family transposase
MLPHWQTPYLGIRSLPRLSGWELDHFFTLTPQERDDICGRFRGLNRLAVTLQLCFLRMTGCALDGVRILPADLLRHIGGQVDVESPTIASVRALYRRKRTRYDHQQWAMDYLGFTPLSPGRRRVLVTRLKQQARTSGDIDALISFAYRWLYEQQIVIPRKRTIKELSARILVEVEHALYLEAIDAVPESVSSEWLDALYQEHPRYQIQLIDWLKTPPAKRSETHLAELFHKIEALKELGVHRYNLPFPLERQRYYATRMRRRFPRRLRAMSPVRRTLELVCFLRVTLMDLVDIVLSQVEKRVSELWAGARHTAERQQYERSQTVWPIVQEIHQTLHDPDISDHQARAAACAIIDPLIGRQPPPRAALTREALTTEPKIRPLLRALMVLDFEATPDHPGWLALKTLRSLYDAGDRELPPDFDIPVPRRWQPLVDDPDRRRAFCAFEAATLYTLRRSLKNGSISVEYSFAYRSRESLLMPLEEWEKSKGKYYKALGLPRSPDKFLANLKEQLQSGLISLDEAVRAGELGIENETIYLPRITAEARPKGTRAVAKAMIDAIGSIQFPNLLLEIDSLTRFSWQLLGRAPKSERDLLALYGALIAQGSELGTARVALMIPGLSVKDIQQAMQLLEEEGALAKANAVVLEFLRRHEIVSHWGDGSLASSDMITLEVSRHLWTARVDHRRRTPSIGSYVHVLDQWGISYDQPIVLNEREAGPAIEGAIRSPGTKIEAVAVDTKGHTHFATGISKVLGLDLYPRLRKLKYQKLFVPKGVTVPDTLLPIIGPTVSLKAVERDWDEFVRLAASVRYGWCSATMALRRYGTAARGEPLYGAGVALGKLVLTRYLCDFLSQPVFRREVLRILDHGESVHALQRAIHHGRPVPKRGRRPGELAAQSGALALLTNIAMAWNTHHMDTIHTAWQQEEPDKLTALMLRHITPVRFEHINFRGVFAFHIGPWRDQLLGGSRRPQTGAAVGK